MFPGAAKPGGGVLEKPCSHTPGLAEDLIFSLRSRPLYNPNHQTYHHHHQQQQQQHASHRVPSHPIPSTLFVFFSSDFDFPPSHPPSPFSLINHKLVLRSPNLARMGFHT
ncbi:hypothetical protein CCUS01_17422 [Colletotrichum cuscutae]|uniref:Uncharacterized protein n=1 Tax=Colletotrichum cuscutae TaxID=1209917 RepID=A0AAI9V760_9PEZI|nr:hypothetical protein CCUS01_17422 [Colletotrichum cuscutae]